MFKIILLSVVCVVALIFTFTKIDPKLQNPSGNSSVTLSLTSQQMKCIVEGQVAHPGQYTMLKEENIGDLIEKAGGFLESADKDAILLDTGLEGRSTVYVPQKTKYATECEVDAAVEKININAATATQIATLNGISQTLAERIVAYRLENGDFLAIEDIKNVNGIGEVTYQKIRDYITLK